MSLAEKIKRWVVIHTISCYDEEFELNLSKISDHDISQIYNKLSQFYLDYDGADKPQECAMNRLDEIETYARELCEKL
jgi:hypothetical protein